MGEVCEALDDLGHHGEGPHRQFAWNFVCSAKCGKPNSVSVSVRGSGGGFLFLLFITYGGVPRNAWTECMRIAETADQAGVMPWCGGARAHTDTHTAEVEELGVEDCWADEAEEHEGRHHRVLHLPVALR